MHVPNISQGVICETIRIKKKQKKHPPHFQDGAEHFGREREGESERVRERES